MKRAALILAGFILCVVALFALLILFIPRDMLKARIGEEIAAWTGRDVSLRGEPEITLFPTLAVTLNDVHVSGPADMPDSEIISMDRLTGTIRLLPLIIGRVEVGSFTMVRPLVRLVRDGEGRRNWAFDSGAAALQLAFAGDVPLGDFTLEGGTVVFEDRVIGTSERLDSVNLSVDWSSVRQPLAVAGSGIWRGEQLTVSARAAQPFAFMNGAPTPLEAEIDSAPITMTFSGAASDYPSSTLSGALQLTTPSLRRFASWLGSPIGPGSTLGQASIAGTAKLSENILSVESASFTLDGNSATGALKVEAGARPNVTGTLALSTLDLTPYFAGITNALASAADWRAVQFDTDWFDDLGADIRLSADSVTLGSMVAGNAAASVSLRERRLEIGLAQAVFNGGSIAGDLAVVDQDQATQATAELQVRATDVAFGGAAPMLGLRQPVSGTASAMLDVATSGHSLADLLAQLRGSGTLDVSDGAVPLFGVADVAEGGEGAGGALAPVPVQTAALKMTFAGGSGAIEADVVADDFSASVQGSVGLLDGALRLNGLVTRGAGGNAATAEANAADIAGAPPAFAIEGTLGAPVVRPVAMAN